MTEVSVADGAKIASGYAYEADPAAWSDDYLSIPNDEWETVIYMPDGAERLLGFVKINGSDCAVFHCSDGLFRAQSVVYVLSLPGSPPEAVVSAKARLDLRKPTQRLTGFQRAAYERDRKIVEAYEEKPMWSFKSGDTHVSVGFDKKECQFVAHVECPNGRRDIYMPRVPADGGRRDDDLGLLEEKARAAISFAVDDGLDCQPDYDERGSQVVFEGTPAHAAARAAAERETRARRVPVALTLPRADVDRLRALAADADDIGTIEEGARHSLLLRTGVEGAEYAVLREREESVDFEAFPDESQARERFEAILARYLEEHPARPGKFEGSGTLGKRLHAIVSDGMQDDEYGDVDGPGGHWYGLITDSGVAGAEHAVVSEDSQGFFNYEAFDTSEAARADFDRIVAEVAEEDEDEEEEEEETFAYHVDLDERGEFRARVEDPDGEDVFLIVQNDENPSALEDSGMRDTGDLEGLRRHLVEVGVIYPGGRLTRV